MRITFNCKIASLGLVFAGVVGCGGGATDTGPSFVAFASDFMGFESWQSETLDSPTASGSTHVSGVRTIYLNKVPPAGATAFPLSTIIVKRTEMDGKIFAQVKRGGGFNANGAVGWEWFELVENTPGVPSIRWRGFYPPAGEAYGGDPTGGCNLCHKVGAANDYVITPGLTLAGFAVDGGAKSDAAATTDAGTKTDGGAKTDAGAETQSEAGADMSADAGTQTDAAGADMSADAGTQTDAAGADDAAHE